MTLNQGYYVSEDDFDNKDCRNNWTANDAKKNVKIYDYEEAINLTGNGRYNIGLLIALSLSIYGMALDMFGFSVIVTGCSCEFELSNKQKTILLSMPFIGPIIMSYTWGYISDTKGRKKSLHISLWISFIVSTLSAFSPNWIVLGVLRLVSTSFCSCAQSTTYTLLGESCPKTATGGYMLVMTSFLHSGFATYTAIAYLILNTEIFFDLSFITFTQWRLLTLILALPLGIAALLLHFYFESPKFLLNTGEEALALENLSKIWQRNGGNINEYPVQNVILNEDGNTERKDVTLLKSLWDQVAPLFKPPLLWRSLQLYLLISIVYGITNSFYLWFPFLAQSFAKELSSSDSVSHIRGMCDMITNSKNVNTTITYNIGCTTKMEASLVLSAAAQGVVFVTLNQMMWKLASRKKFMTIAFFTISTAMSIGAVTVANNMASFIMFFGMLLIGLSVCFIFTYIVDLYPTSYRGMASCLGVMVARLSALVGIYLVGAYMTSHCTVVLYSCAAYIFIGVVVACFLPPDKLKA